MHNDVPCNRIFVDILIYVLFDMKISATQILLILQHAINTLARTKL